MTATIRNKVNPWFARVNHVKLPRWSINKLYVETDGSPVDGGGPGPDPTEPWTPAETDTVAWFDAVDVPVGSAATWPNKANAANAPDLTATTPGVSNGAGVVFDPGQGMTCAPTDTFGLCVVVYSGLTESQMPTGPNQSVIPLIDHSATMEAFIYGPAAPDDPDMSLDGGSSGNATGGGAMANGNEPFIDSKDPGFLGYGAAARTSTGTVSMVEYYLDTPFPIIGLATMREGGFVGGSTIYEVLALPTGTTADTRYKVEGYLAWKWGFEDKLPETHIYKNEAPTL